MLNQPEQSLEEREEQLRNNITLFENETTRLMKLEHALKLQIEELQKTIRDLEHEEEKKKRNVDSIDLALGQVTAEYLKEKALLEEIQKQERETGQNVLRLSEEEQRLSHDIEEESIVLLEERNKIEERNKNLSEKENRLNTVTRELRELIERL